MLSPSCSCRDCRKENVDGRTVDCMNRVCRKVAAHYHQFIQRFYSTIRCSIPRPTHRYLTQSIPIPLYSLWCYIRLWRVICLLTLIIETTTPSSASTGCEGGRLYRGGVPPRVCGRANRGRGVRDGFEENRQCRAMFRSWSGSFLERWWRRQSCWW